MKVLHINCLDFGSTGKIIYEISKQVHSRGGKSILCTPKIVANNQRSDILKKYLISSKNQQRINRYISAIIGWQYGILSPSTYKIISVIKKEAPDIVHFHSANCYMADIYKIFRYLAKKQIPCVITNHAEFYYTGSCSHANECEQWINGCKKCPDVRSASKSLFVDTSRAAWKKMQSHFSRMKHLTVVSVSPWVNERSSRSGIMAGVKQTTILNGVDTSIFSVKDDTKIYEKYGIPRSSKIVLSVTASFTDGPNDPKGGYHLIEIAKMLSHSNITFVVAGPCCVNRALPDNMILLGAVKDQTELASLYSSADLTVVTGKRETFSMPVAESLCCGTPVVGFKAGGPESIALPEFSLFVEYASTDALSNAIISMIDCKKNNSAESISSIAQDTYSSHKMAHLYFELYCSLIQRRNNYHSEKQDLDNE